MIKIKVSWIKRENIKSICIEGHARSAPKGEDLVCAGLSAISIGFVNALNMVKKDEKINIVVKEGYILINFLEVCNNPQLNLLMKFFYYELTWFQKKNKKYISFEEYMV